MTVAEIKNQIALKQKELTKLKELLKKEEEKTKLNYTFIRHYSHNGKTYTYSKKHLCNEKTFKELIRVAKCDINHSEKRWKATVWYELLNNDTNKVELIIE
jgi:predicted solute-binding protein